MSALHPTISIRDLKPSIKRQQEQPRSRVPGDSVAFGSEGAEIPYAYVIEPAGFGKRLRMKMHFTVSESHGLSAMEDVISLQATVPGLGGKRWWFVCPTCRKRREKLALGETQGRFLCGKCIKDGQQ